MAVAIGLTLGALLAFPDSEKALLLIAIVLQKLHNLVRYGGEVYAV